MNFMDFAQRNSRCHALPDGFVLLQADGRSDSTPVCLEVLDSDMIVHALVIAGELKVGWGNRRYSLTSGCFANFLDNPLLEVLDISADARAFVMLFSASFITSLLKNTPPFPPSYVLKVKMLPVSVVSAQTVRIFQKRIESIVEIFNDDSHCFRAEMLKCALRMFMMDIANEHIRQENESGELSSVGRKNVLFKQFIRLLLARVRHKHTVGWYASQLCVTPQYLNRVVKSTSQKTAYEHICTTLVGALIDQLENTEEPVSQIAEAFHFPDLATMTKFFKRQTGKTPTEYRKSLK